MDLERLNTHVPQLLQNLPSDTLKRLQRTNRNLRLEVESSVSTISIHDSNFVFLLAARRPSLRRLNVTTRMPYTPKTIAVYTWRHIVTIDFNQAKLTEADLAKLASCWPNLQHINLSHSNLHSKGMAALHHGDWPRLKTLQLKKCNLDSGSIAYLVTAPWPNLEFLDLEGNRLDPADLAQLCMGRWVQLRKLDLSSFCKSTLDHWRLREEVVSLFTDDLSRAAWPSMSHLRLCDCEVRDVGMKSLVCCQWSRMQELDISSQDLHTSDFCQLGQAHWPLLQVLNLRDTMLNEQDMTEIIKGDWPKLACLDVPYNYGAYGSYVWLGDTEGFDTATTKVLAQGKWPLLEKLNMRGNFLDAAGMSELVKGVWPLLKVLDVNCQGLDVTGVHVLVSEGGVFPLLECLELPDLSKPYQEDGLFGELVASSNGQDCQSSLLASQNYASRARVTVGASWPHLQELYFGDYDFTRCTYPLICSHWFDVWDDSLDQGKPGVCQSVQ